MKQLLLEPPVAIWILSIILILVKLANRGPELANRGYLLYRIK
jgi:hypothetical protein